MEMCHYSEKRFLASLSTTEGQRVINTKAASTLIGKSSSSNLTKNLFVAGGVGLALHNGPLHKNKSDCEHHSDCGFGYRVLPRLSGEIGTKFWHNHGLSLFYDHMSHKGILPGENEGIDHLGIRYHYTFDNPRPRN